MKMSKRGDLLIIFGTNISEVAMETEGEKLFGEEL